MNIPITYESEDYTTEIETYVQGGVLVHKIKFLTEAQLSVKEQRESMQYDGEGGDEY